MILNFSQILSDPVDFNLYDYFIKKECYQRFPKSYSPSHALFSVPIDSKNVNYVDESVRSFLLLKESDDLQF